MLLCIQEAFMKQKCAHCGGKLGLGIKFRNLWNGRGWDHLRFCSSRCESRYESERRHDNARNGWLSALAKNP